MQFRIQYSYNLFGVDSKNREEENTFRKEAIETAEDGSRDGREERVGPETRSRSRNKREEKEDVIGAYWMVKQNSECFDDCAIYVVEVPKKDHGKKEVIEAKEREVSNLKDFDTFEEVAEEGQKKVGSRWVITKKEKQDGQKTDYKARIVAKGFHEEEKPQSDSPTAMRESVKPFLAIAANQGFDLESVDIRAAFLQSNPLDRDVFIEPPKDLKKENVIWKLRKPLYGLDDASRKFWLRMKELFGKMGLKTVTGDEAFYFRHRDNKLEGMILSHVDDFNVAGTEKFLSEIREMLKKELSVSKLEKNKFRFTGVDIEKTEKGITISMEEYAESLEFIEEIRAAPLDEELTKIENKT